MRTIIAGSRSIVNYGLVDEAVRDSGFSVTEVVSGTAGGGDMLGELYARNNGLLLSRFPADWRKHGRSAGVIRNRVMAEYADALIAVWDGSSRGTANMIETANGLGLAVFVSKCMTNGART